MAMKEITDDFNSLFLDARKEYLEALKAESKTQYDKFIKDLGKHCIKPAWRLCTQSACRFSVRLPRNPLPYGSMPAEFLGNLPKNLTTHLTHKLYSVFPKNHYRGKNFWAVPHKAGA